MSNIKIDNLKDNKLTNFGKTTLKDRYLFRNETIQEMFARVASMYSDNDEHAQRIYNYMSDLWFMPATPILANGGTNRGLPISCFLNEAQDSLESIASLSNENVFLAARGGGIGSYWGNVRSHGETIRDKGPSAGVIPFLKWQDAQTLAISQGAIRRGSTAVYLNDTHPEIEEFIDMRRPVGDPNRRCLNLHHGVVLSDAFMNAVFLGEKWDLKSPATGKIVSSIPARDLWIKILTARVETGEPYILFIDNVNKSLPDVYKKNNLTVKTSNLCNEITLSTGKDFLGNERTAVCCLSSLNLEYYKEWENNTDFINDVMCFLDNVLQDFIDKAPDEMAKAKYSATRERSVGLGVMGFHSFLQSQRVPFEGVVAKSWNKRIFTHIKTSCDKASNDIAKAKGACPDAALVDIMERFSHKTAVAPTASISNICGESSPGIEPYAGNVFTQKTLSGSFVVKNKNLKQLLIEKQQDNDGVWSSIAINNGSVQHLDFLSDNEKAIFKTSFEIDQSWIIEHAGDRANLIDQGQSLNLFFPGDVQKKTLQEAHFKAWRKGIKGLYYCRSKSVQQADIVSTKSTSTSSGELNVTNSMEECLSCQ